MQNKKRDLKRLYKPPSQEDYSESYKRLIIVIIISFVFIAGQIFGGIISNSIAIISDAIHLITDTVGFVISFVFIYLSKNKPNQKMTFGYHRMELLGALANLFVIWFLVIFVMYEATQRLVQKQFVQKPLVMLITAGGGLLINILMYKILHGGKSHSHGLMSDSCGGHHQNQTQTECMQLCNDTQCISQVRQQHCHKKDSDNGIHKHIKKQKHQHVHVHGQNCNHEKDKKQIKKQKQHQHHQHGNCSHSHAPPKEIQNKKIELGQTMEKFNPDQITHEKHDHSQHSHSHDHHDHNHGEAHESIGMQAAILHALSDMIMSVGLLISSFIIFFLGSDKGSDVHEWNAWHLFDPISTYIFSIITIISTFPVAANCYYLMMESTPSYIDIAKLKDDCEKMDGVLDMHDIHVWDLKPGKTILIAHVFARNGMERKVLTQLTDKCRELKIYHSTFQVEQQDLKDDEQYILCHHDIH